MKNEWLDRKKEREWKCNGCYLVMDGDLVAISYTVYTPPEMMEAIIKNGIKFTKEDSNGKV